MVYSGYNYHQLSPMITNYEPLLTTINHGFQPPPWYISKCSPFAAPEHQGRNGLIAILDQPWMISMENEENAHITWMICRININKSPVVHVLPCFCWLLHTSYTSLFVGVSMNDPQ